MTGRRTGTERGRPALGASTLSQTFEESADRHAGGVAQLYKGGVADRSLVADGIVDPAPPGEFAALSYGRLRGLVRTLAAGFRDLGVAADDRVGIFARTRMEWAQCDLGVLAAGAVVTTLSPTASTEQVRRLLVDAGATGVVVDTAARLEQLLTAAEDTDCEFAIVMDDLGAVGDPTTTDGSDTANLERDIEASPIAVHSLATVYERGAETFEETRYRRWLRERTPSELASIVYTSGTTGDPKGVRLTHGTLSANVQQCRRRLDSLTASDRALSVLPLSHVFERLAGHFLLLSAGATIAYAESTDTLREDFQAVRPTVGTSVPRLYEKLYDAARERADRSRLSRRLFEWADRVAVAWAEADEPGVGLRLRRTIADRLVYRRVRAALGGRVRFLVSGGASLSPELCRRFHGMGVPVLEGYGLTETAPVIAVNSPAEPKIGTVGPPLDGVEGRLDTDVNGGLAPVDGGDVGELLVRGPNVTDGYWNDPEATDAAFTDSWFRTGDVVERRPDGYLRFRERAKSILTLSTGKNVAPVPLENALTVDRLVEQAMVVGDRRRFVAALLVPDVDALREWADDDGIALPAASVECCEDERVRDRIAGTVEEVNDRLEPHERIGRFRLVPESFTEENGLLTPTLKKKRRAIREQYADEIEALYEA